MTEDRGAEMEQTLTGSGTGSARPASDARAPLIEFRGVGKTFRTKERTILVRSKM